MKTIYYTPDRVKKELIEHIPVHLHVGDPELRIKRTDAHRLENLHRAALAYIQHLEDKGAEKNNDILTQDDIINERTKMLEEACERIEILGAQLTDAEKNHQHTIEIAERQKKQIEKLENVIVRMNNELKQEREKALVPHDGGTRCRRDSFMNKW